MARAGRGFPSRRNRLLLGASVLSSVQWTEFLPDRNLLDPAEYGSATYELEAVGFTSNGSLPVYARLYNVTLAGPVTGSTFLVTAALAKTFTRGTAFSLDSGANEYAVQYGCGAGATATLHAAKLRAVPA